MRPRVLNINDLDEIPKGAVLCDRKSPYGNPFIIGRDGNREKVCFLFEREILPTLDVSPLKGKDLLCHCVPKMCHCYSILRKANGFATVLVTGGRDFLNIRFITEVLDFFHAEIGIGKMVQGYARGADRLADNWARKNGVWTTKRQYEVTDNDWRTKGLAAGHIRNSLMLGEERPDIVIAFPGGKGTNNMLSQALRSGEPKVFNMAGAFEVWKKRQRLNLLDWRIV